MFHIIITKDNINNPLEETDAVITNLKNNKIDLLIGTHRILSDDIKPSNLGLLIIDEEQRFGVTHKEKIKEIWILFP